MGNHHPPSPWALRATARDYRSTAAQLEESLPIGQMAPAETLDQITNYHLLADECERAADRMEGISTVPPSARRSGDLLAGALFLIAATIMLAGQL